MFYLWASLQLELTRLWMQDLNTKYRETKVQGVIIIILHGAEHLDYCLINKLNRVENGDGLR